MKHFVPVVIALFLSACSAPQTKETAVKAPHSAADVNSVTTDTLPVPGAYMIVIGRDYKAEDIAPYAASLIPIYEQYGGRYVVLTTGLDIAEGKINGKAIVVTAWPDVTAARAFWDSPEYREAMKLRDGIGEFDVVIVPALPKAE